MSDGGGLAYDGSDGDGLGAANLGIAANPAAMTYSGQTIQDITVSPATGIGAAIGAILDQLASLFGITPAQAAGREFALVYSGPDLVGVLIGPPGFEFPGNPMTLATALRSMGARLGANNMITSKDGSMTGGIFARGNVQVTFEPVGPEEGNDATDNGFSVGPVNLDSTVVTVNAVTDAGTMQVGVILPEVFGQITSLDGVPITSAAPYTMTNGINTSNGLPIIDSANAAAMFAKKPAFFRPSIIAGKDGAYSLNTTQRMAPPVNLAPAPTGFSIGATANYQLGYLYLGGTAQGYMVVVANTSEISNLIDPTTGKAPVIVSWTWLRFCNGSQFVGLCPSLSPGYAYTGALPTASNPFYNAADQVSPVVALTQLTSSVSTVTTFTNFNDMNPAYNAGGTEANGGGQG